MRSETGAPAVRREAGEDWSRRRPIYSQPTGSPTQYEVIADAQIVGRITLSSSLPAP